MPRAKKRRKVVTRAVKQAVVGDGVKVVRRRGPKLHPIAAKILDREQLRDVAQTSMSALAAGLIAADNETRLARASGANVTEEII